MLNKRQEFKLKLRAIHKELCAYSETVFNDMTLQKAAIVSLKYSVILQAIEDLYYGCEEDQSSAIAYFKSELYKDDCVLVSISEYAMNKIVYSVDDYAEKIGYEENNEDDDFLYM